MVLQFYFVSLCLNNIQTEASHRVDIFYLQFCTSIFTFSFQQMSVQFLTIFKSEKDIIILYN